MIIGEMEVEEFDDEERSNSELDVESMKLLEKNIDKIKAMPTLKNRHIRIDITDIYLNDLFNETLKEDPESLLNSLNRVLKELAITHIPEYARQFDDFPDLMITCAACGK